MTDEQTTKTETQPTSSESNSQTGNIPSSSSLIDAANSAAERLERANQVQAQLLKQAEEIQARNILGGRSEIGAPAPQPISDKEYAKLVMSGQIPKL